jgi:N-acetylglucosamine-6-sulfatase
LIRQRVAALINRGHAPRDYSTDVLTRFRDRSHPPAGTVTSAVLHLGRVRGAHGAAPDERRKYFNDVDAPIPAPRHLGRYQSAPLPHPAAFNEGDVSDKPDFIEKARLTSQQIPAVTAGYRHQLESLLAVDEAVRDRRHTPPGRRAERTLIIFSSDNGFGEHRIPDGKLLPYEPTIRVPLIMRGPGVPCNQHRRQLVANIATWRQRSSRWPARVRAG